MIRSATALVAIGGLAIPAHMLAAAEIEIKAQGPVVELSIFESVTVAPDIATIGAGVTTEAPTAVIAMRQNAAAMQAVIARIKASGVADKDIQTTGINLNARYDYDQSTRRQVFRGYQASNRVDVILRKSDATGTVLDALVAARKRAIERAQAQVREYATLLGYEGAKVLAIGEAIEGQGPMPLVKMSRSDAIQLTASAPVEPGMVSAGVTITIKYELTKAEPATAG